MTGASGQLGSALKEIQPRWAEVHLLPKTLLDITDRLAVNRTVNVISPDWIVNAAGYTAVDRAESERDQAFNVNAVGATNIAEIASKKRVKMIQVSTDYIFDGQSSKPYEINDTPNPINVYGESKLAGERQTKDIMGDNLLILRTAWIYSKKGPSFLTSMRRLLSERRELKVINDQFGTPTRAKNLAKAVFVAIQKDVMGVHHWTDDGVTNWYEFACAIRADMLKNGLLKKAATIEATPSSMFPTPAKRPSYSVLDTIHTRAILDITGKHWRDSLAEEIVNTEVGK